MIIPLTTVRQHEQQMGETAVQMLEAERSDPVHVHHHVALEPVLLVRASSRVSCGPDRLAQAPADSCAGAIGPRNTTLISRPVSARSIEPVCIWSMAE